MLNKTNCTVLCQRNLQHSGCTSYVPLHVVNADVEENSQMISLTSVIKIHSLRKKDCEFMVGSRLFKRYSHPDYISKGRRFQTNICSFSPKVYTTLAKRGVLFQGYPPWIVKKYKTEKKFQGFQCTQEMRFCRTFIYRYCLVF